MLDSMTPDSPSKFPPTREDLLSEGVTCNFLWDFGSRYYIDLGPLGNWVWSDPVSGGNNTLSFYPGTYSAFCSQYWEGFTCLDTGNAPLAQKINGLTLIVY